MTRIIPQKTIERRFTYFPIFNWLAPYCIATFHRVYRFIFKQREASIETEFTMKACQNRTCGYNSSAAEKPTKIQAF